MARITDQEHYKRLNDLGIVLKTNYLDQGSIHSISTDGIFNDNIKSGIRVEKDYIKNNKIIYKTTDFDSRIEYSYIKSEEESKEITCPNCGNPGHVKDFLDGCPYCGTYYNINYKYKELGSKKNYDQILKNNTYRVITFLIDVIFSMLIVYLYIRLTGRTFNQYDVFKIIVGGIVLSLMLYFVFYTLDACIILLPIKIYKSIQNKNQISFWKSTKLDKNKFYNNLNYELKKYFYSDENKDIIDYDILDYIKFESIAEDNAFIVNTTLNVRLIKYKDDVLLPFNNTIVVSLKKINNQPYNLNEGKNIISCPKCGASIDVSKNKCKYCGYLYNYVQEWYLIDVKYTK